MILMPHRLLYVGAYFGNCGYSWVTKQHVKKSEKHYHACGTELDKFCGLLHCQIGKEVNPRIVNYQSVKHTMDDPNCYSRIVSFDVGKIFSMSSSTYYWKQ